MPHNFDAERIILGAIYLDNFLIEEVKNKLPLNAFMIEAHRVILRAMVSLAERKMTIDYITLPDELTRTDQLEAIGGRARLSELLDDAYKVSDLTSTIKLVWDDYVRRSMAYGGQALTNAALDPTSEIEDLVHAAEKLAFDTQDRSTKVESKWAVDALRSALEEIEAAMEAQKPAPGIPSGFRDLDLMTAGFHKKELIVLAARPRVGKTSLAFQFAFNAAKQGYVVMFESMEMAIDQLIARMACGLAGVNLHKWRLRILGRKDWTNLTGALNTIADLPLLIEYCADFTLSQIRSRALRTRAEKGKLDLLVIDYLQLMGGPGKNDYEIVSYNCRGLKKLAGELDIPIIALSQTNRSSEKRTDKRHLLSDLADCGKIERDSDVVMFIDRDDLDKTEKQEPDGLADLTIAKQRNGPQDPIKLRFEGQYTRFSDYEERKF